MTTRKLDKFAIANLAVAGNADAMRTLLLNIVARLDRAEDLVQNVIFDSSSTAVSENTRVHRLPDAVAEENLDAHDLASALVLLNSLKTQYTAHIGSATAHAVADAVNTVAAADATDQASAETLANELKGDMNTHRSQATIHDNNDAGNIVSSADATDLATLLVLVNEMKADFNGHVAGSNAQGMLLSDDMNESILV